MKHRKEMGTDRIPLEVRNCFREKGIATSYTLLDLLQNIRAREKARENAETV